MRSRIDEFQLAYHDIDSVALIEGRPVVNTSGIVAIVSAIVGSPVGSWNRSVIAGGESAAKADGAIATNRTIATNPSASVASTSYGKAPPAATRSHPAECFIACQKESGGG